MAEDDLESFLGDLFEVYLTCQQGKDLIDRLVSAIFRSMDQAIPFTNLEEEIVRILQEDPIERYLREEAECRKVELDDIVEEVADSIPAIIDLTAMKIVMQEQEHIKQLATSGNGYDLPPVNMALLQEGRQRYQDQEKRRMRSDEGARRQQFNNRCNLLKRVFKEGMRGSPSSSQDLRQLLQPQQQEHLQRSRIILPQQQQQQKSKIILPQQQQQPQELRRPQIARQEGVKAGSLSQIAPQGGTISIAQQQGGLISIPQQQQQQTPLQQVLVAGGQHQQQPQVLHVQQQQHQPLHAPVHAQEVHYGQQQQQQPALPQDPTLAAAAAAPSPPVLVQPEPSSSCNNISFNLDELLGEHAMFSTTEVSNCTHTFEAISNYNAIEMKGNSPLYKRNLHLFSRKWTTFKLPPLPWTRGRRRRRSLLPLLWPVSSPSPSGSACDPYPLRLRLDSSRRRSLSRSRSRTNSSSSSPGFPPGPEEEGSAPVR